MPRKSTKVPAETAEAVKVEVTESKTENIKAEEKVAETKKEPVKRGRKKAEAAPVKAEVKSEVKSEAKPEVKKSAGRKSEVVCELHVQFGGKSYTQDDLKKIAADVWKYDLKQKVGDLKSVELYVKPEESKVYYVMNNEFKGNFDI